MILKHFACTAVLALAACAPSPEERAIDDASVNAAARIWSDPSVARAINISATLVADFKPGVDPLFNSIPMPLGMATFGEFDEFVMVFFDENLTTQSQVRAGMKRYCRTVMGRRLVDVGGGTMDVPPNSNAKAWGYSAGNCR